MEKLDFKLNAMKIIKPDLTMYFNQMPFIGRYMKYDYECVTTLDDMIRLHHKWLENADVSTNLIIKINFQAAANYIYTLITGKSFDSKTVELLIKEIQ